MKIVTIVLAFVFIQACSAYPDARLPDDLHLFTDAPPRYESSDLYSIEMPPPCKMRVVESGGVTRIVYAGVCNQ